MVCRILGECWLVTVVIVVFDGAADRRALLPQHKPPVTGDDGVFADLPRIHDGHDWEDTVAKDPDESKKGPGAGKNARDDPARADGKVTGGTQNDPREPKPDGKHDR